MPTLARHEPGTLLIIGIWRPEQQYDEALTPAEHTRPVLPD